MVPRLQAGDALPGEGGQGLDLPHGGVHPLRKRRRRRDGLAGDSGVCLPEEPGVAEGAPAHGAEIRSGVAQDVGRVLAGENVPVCDDGDLHRLLDLADDVPVRLAGVHLYPGAAVDAESVRPGALQHPGKFHRVHAAPVPALAELHRDGDGHGLLHRLHDLPGQLRRAHQGGAVPGFHDLPHGAAHVDVQELRAGELQRHGRGLGQHLRLVAEELHRQGALLRQAVEQGLGLFVPVAERPGGDHLRDGKGGALLPAEGAEGEVRHSRHGRQGHAPLQCNISDSYHRLLKTENSKLKTEDPVPRGSGRCPSPRGG